MAKQIRLMMQHGDNPLSGIVKIDETYIGGKHLRDGMLDNKTAVIGMIEKQKEVWFGQNRLALWAGPILCFRVSVSVELLCH